MHEASLVQGLLKIVFNALEDYKKENPAQSDLSIVQITCEGGLLASFESRTLKACFEIFTEGTPAENAELVIETSPLKCKCARCGEDFQLFERKFICPHCGSEELSFSGGHGLVLKGVKMEEKANG